MSAAGFLENALAPFISLTGAWDFQLGQHAPQTIDVPSAWEAHMRDKVTDGPALYRREFVLPENWLNGQRIILEALAISFSAAVRVNGREAGSHLGLWSPFQLDVTDHVQPGGNTLEIEIWKPGGRYPLREALAGFLGDVATTFGGVWQGIGLRAFDAALRNVEVLGAGAGWLTIKGEASGSLAAGTYVRAELADAAGACLRQAQQQTAGAFQVSLDTHGLARWQVVWPALYCVVVTLWDAETCLARVERRVGLRDVAVIDGQACLDGRPLHMRGVLDWGWHAERLCPAPSREELRRQFAQARSLGFNLIKLCLFVPDETTFEVADEEGMLLWLEMPLWLPRVTPDLRALALREYEAVFRRVHHHPSIVVLSLGCELNAQVDASFLQALHALARASFPNVLHCDNSGSAEAYGGVATRLSDFYDYHFYTDPHFFTALIDHFDRAYQPKRPWLLGEFCDADTCRDFSALEPEPWWLTELLRLDRDDLLSMRAYRERFAAAGITDGGASLVRTGARQATAIRKYILEQIRAHSATGGYVISGWCDTPITTSGIVDDAGRLKFAPELWRAFNADGVLLVDRERRRRWIGGDRPAYKDPLTWRMGEKVELHVLFSNGMADFVEARVRWRLATSAGELLDNGEQPVGRVRGGEVQEIAILRLVMPVIGHACPAELSLSVELAVPGEPPIHNAWTVWCVPTAQLPPKLAVERGLADRIALSSLDRQAGVIELSAADSGGEPMLAAALSQALLERVAAGGQAVIWQLDPDARFTRRLPFWREAIHVFEHDSLWEPVPQPGYADMRFFSVASDLALDVAALQDTLGVRAVCRPVWRRFDARGLFWTAYLVDVQYGAGRMWVSSLRFAGGLGRQPDGFDTNFMGAWLLAKLLEGRSQG